MSTHTFWGDESCHVNCVHCSHLSLTFWASKFHSTCIEQLKASYLECLRFNGLGVQCVCFRTRHNKVQRAGLHGYSRFGPTNNLERLSNKNFEGDISQDRKLFPMKVQSTPTTHYDNRTMRGQGCLEKRAGIAQYLSENRSSLTCTASVELLRRYQDPAF